MNKSNKKESLPEKLDDLKIHFFDDLKIALILGPVFAERIS
jgi:hypothetical protein